MSSAGRVGRSRNVSRRPRRCFSTGDRFLAGLGAAGALAVSGRRALADDAGPLGRALSGQAQPGLYARPRRHAREVQSQLQQFLRVQHQQARRRERAEDPPVDGEARRHGREGADGRHRYADQDDGARGAALPSPLRRGLVDGDSLDRLPAEEAGRVRQAAVVGEVRPVRDLPRQEDGAGPALVHALALCRGPDHGGGDQRSRLHRDGRLRQAARQGPGRADPARHALEIRLQVDQVDRARSRSSTSGPRPSGRPSGRTSTASGPTSIRTCRIRAGARPRRPSSTTGSCVRR